MRDVEGAIPYEARLHCWDCKSSRKIETDLTMAGSVFLRFYGWGGRWRG